MTPTVEIFIVVYVTLVALFIVWQKIALKGLNARLLSLHGRVTKDLDEITKIRTKVQEELNKANRQREVK